MDHRFYGYYGAGGWLGLGVEIGKGEGGRDVIGEGVGLWGWDINDFS